MFVNANFLTKPITGLERYALELSLAIQNYKNDITFLTPNRIFPYTNYDISKLRICMLGYSKNYLWEQIELPLYLRRCRKPLLLNLTNTAPVFYNNQITVIHDVAFMHNPKWYTKKAALFFEKIVTQSARSSKHIITVSQFSKGQIEKYLKIPAEKITVIPEGISSSILKLSAFDYTNNYGNYVLAVATLEPRKNLKNLILAFNQTALKGYKLLIVGNLNKVVFRDPEFKEIDLNENIIFLGYVDDSTLTGLYKNAKLFTYISYYEGFGIPPLEAIVCGCPVLASNSSSLPEVLGKFAQYCDPNNIKEISEKIVEMISKNERIGKKEIEEISSKYNWEKSASLFFETINRCS